MVSVRVAASVLAERTGLPVAPVDVRDLAELGLFTVVMPDTVMLVELDGFSAVRDLRQIVDARRSWWVSSIDRWDAAAALGMPVPEFEELAARHRLRPGRFGRYRLSDVDRLREGAHPHEQAELPHLPTVAVPVAAETADQLDRLQRDEA